jgi:EAL domain-containing protein (putative c-di-GMP-specific phosphodiesterase class I)
VRWRHPQRGLIAPGEFIAVAEESGLIVRIGAWVLRTACRQVAAWHASGYPRLRIAVNFSARQFQDPDMPVLVREALAESGLSGDALEIEITEGTAMSNVELSARTLDELERLGVQLSIDDFGNSYSTLGHLRRFPFKTLKIDQTFLRDVAHDVGNAAITTAITAMARSLNLRVVAEGIETEDQLEFMRAQQCDEAQGYLFSHPLPAAELAGWLQDNARRPGDTPPS